MMSRAFADLASELEAAFSAGATNPWTEEAFADFALRCFALQFQENPAYRSLCEARQINPDTIECWEHAPAVPATAFKHLDLVTGAANSAEAVFRTSGTTRGGTRRGRHLVPHLGLYRASAVPNFAAYLMPEGERLRLLSLIPSPGDAPDSSLSAMMGMVSDDLCSGTDWVVDGRGVLDMDRVREVAANGQPLLVAGTASALVHLLGALDGGESLKLAPGTRLMETGGFKGGGEAVSKHDLHRRLGEGLGVPPGRIVNEYGMTELLSQLYEPVLSQGLRNERVTERTHVAPPWLKVRALDPVTLAPLEAGQEGLLAFYDLANLGSVCHVLTEDVGSVAADGVRLRGRFPGSEPRGCSRAMDELLAATAEAP